jgi:predicted HD superfamily hydrolase involved in NAD metabolism
VPAHEIDRGEEIVALLRERLPEQTVRHSLSVAGLMAALAGMAGVPRDPAVKAGLLHDLCKAMDPDALLARADAYGIAINDTQLYKPNLLHGPVAAEEARRLLGIEDEAVYDAIYWHTTGRPGWGRLGLALYVADFSEPLREFPEAAEARRILETRGFDAALCYVSDERLAEVRKKPHVDPNTETFHAWLHSNNGYCS